MTTNYEDILAKLIKLETKLAECEKDAARYQWFAANLDTSDPTNPLNVLADAIGNRAPTKNELDAAIDAAMKEST